MSRQMYSRISINEKLAREVLNAQMPEKTRTANFSDKEVRLILKIVTKYVNVLENKQGDANNLKLKRLTWKQVAKEYNEWQSTTMDRTWEQIKVKYESLKKQARKEEARLKQGQDCSHGDRKISEISTKVLNMLRSASSNAVVPTTQNTAVNDISSRTKVEEQDELVVETTATGDELTTSTVDYETNGSLMSATEPMDQADAFSSVSFEQDLALKEFNCREQRAQELHEKELVIKELTIQKLQLQLELLKKQLNS